MGMNGFKIVLYAMLGLILLIAQVAIFYGVIRFIANSLGKWLFVWQDHSTGLVRMKEMVQQEARNQAYNMANAIPDETYGDYALNIGMLDSSGYVDRLNLSGNYRPTHIYVVGASGSGKSSLLKNLLIQDLNNGMGLCVIDPHGDLIQDILPFLNQRKEQTVLLDLADTENMLPYNPLERREGVLISEQVAKLVLAFKRIWGDSWGARMEDILRHSLAILIEQGYTLNEFDRLLTDADFRKMLCENSKLDQATDFFYGRFNIMSRQERARQIESSLNKVSAFMADDRIGMRLSEPKSALNIRKIMDDNGVLLVNLAKGRLAGNADLFGALLMADLEMSFLSRPVDKRHPFALYVDEFQNIATESFETVLTEARKFGLCLTMAHQSLKQVDDKLISLILGNAQTQIYFRVARADAERLAKESVNIVEQLIDRETPLIQQAEHKFSLAELWEIAFHNLARLEQREAYVMVKGTMEHPEMIRTEDNPHARPVEHDFDERYLSLQDCQIFRSKRRVELEMRIEKYVEEQEREGSARNRGGNDKPPDISKVE